MKTSVTDEAVTHHNLSLDFGKMLADFQAFRDDKVRSSSGGFATRRGTAS